MACSQGAEARLGINDVEFEFISLQGGARYALVDNTIQAIRGTYSRSKERVKEGLIYIDLYVRMQPTPTELDTLIPLFGFAETPTDTFTVSDSELTSFTVVVDRVAKVHTYANCKINRATFSGQKGQQPVSVDLHIMGVTETEGNAGTFSTGTALDATDQPYAFTDGVMTLRSSARQYDRFALSIDNKIQREFNNSQTATNICRTDREITLATSVPYVAANTDLYTTPGPGGPDASGAAGTLVFTDGGQSTTFSFANLKELAQSTPIPGKRELRLPLNYRVYKSGSTEELIITHDATP